MKKQFKKIKKESEEIKKEVKQKTIGYIATAFGLVAGLAWNEAVKALIEYIFPLGRDTLLLKFAYAILITLVLTFISVYLIKLFKSEEKKI